MFLSRRLILRLRFLFGAVRFVVGPGLGFFVLFGRRFGFEDQVSPAKAVAKFIKDTKKGAILGGALDGNLLSAKEAEALAKMPSKEELHAKILGSINSPASGIVGSINAVMAQLTRAMAAVRDQKSA